MAKIQFKIVGTPVPKGRPRFFRTGSHVGTYTPKKTRQWENIIALQTAKHRPKILWKGPIIMALIFMMPRSKSLSKKVVYHIRKPDIDNLAKSVKDALQGLIYHSDSQIIQLWVDKLYATNECGVLVTMEGVET